MSEQMHVNVSDDDFWELQNLSLQLDGHRATEARNAMGAILTKSVKALGGHFDLARSLSGEHTALRIIKP